VVLLSISRENGCDYCVSAHSFLADRASGVPVEVTDAIREGQPCPDARLAVLSAFTQHLVSTRGRPARTEADVFLSNGYTETQMLYLILAIAVKTISNYSNHIFETPLDAAFASRAYDSSASTHQG
jgi:AhpD family alkylhydroperoxidase